MSTLIPFELEEIINNSKERHSLFQLKYFLIGKEPTIQSKLWRCIRELKARKDTSTSLLLEIEDVKDDRELIQLNIDEILEQNASITNEIMIKKADLSIRKLKRKQQELLNRLENLNNRLNSLKEEIDYLCRSYESLSQIEPLKPYDDLNSQKQYWDEKLSQDLYLRNVFNAPADLELIKTILALNHDSPLKKATQNLINEAQTKIENKNKQKEYDDMLDSIESQDCFKSEKPNLKGINDI